MTCLQKVRPLLLVFGGLLLIGSLLGAKVLTAGGSEDNGQSPGEPTNGKDGSGPVVLGYADSDPSPIKPGLPPVLQSGEVAEVFVKAGDEVKAGDKLYRFNTTIYQAKLDTAQAGVASAKAELAKAEGAAAQHAKKVDLQRQVVAAAKDKEQLALEARKLAEWNANENYRIQGVPKEQWEEKRKYDIKLFELYKEHTVAKREHELAQAQLADVEAAKANQVDKLVDLAKAELHRVESLVNEADKAIELCTVKAKVDGTVERVYITPGDVMGISSREPAMILIPAGPRVIRAEVEAEFAHRIGQDKIGKTVTIYDNTDPKVQYKGVVKRIGTTFLPKRTNEGGFVPNETRVLEAVIEVTDPSPRGMPPLRVGQKVRVNFGQ